MTAIDNDARAPYLTRIDFLIELARRLHIYGTSAQRIEGAMAQVARRLEVEAEIWSNPTGMLMSFADIERGAPHKITQIIRLEPGDTNLGRLAAADAIAEDVVSGRLHIREGLQAMRALDRPARAYAKPLAVFSFGLASASVAGLLSRTGWADLITAALLGAMIGALTIYSETRPRWADAHEALAGFIATIAASAVASFIAPLSLQGVIIAALIVLMPGLTLTNAVSELTSQQLVSGTARFAGALTVLLKLTFGAVAGSHVVGLFGWQPLSNEASTVLPTWMPWLTLLAGSFAFAVLFKAARRDVLLVMASVWLGYIATKFAATFPGAQNNTLPTGVFFAGMVVTAVSNAYGRYWNRPGALIRVPGIILLVPGSLGFRSLNFVFARDVMSGLDTAFAVIMALIALVAGILFGSLLISPRRNL
ncbi:MAG TPA: threonine/serine exporter family protein [Arenimonas sp.]|uniref:threonine/serine ThrE exporter family protein n=1 Tax=Arenimonas sp. TaxID=1872635 RepID=UPI002B992854|nr:threonine/serine exporter family protein [Arenimonas sp.]HMB56738.1 threonine/serine exporter family protein [Arenimonas sp.]